jgi:hypothetical protein
MIKTIIIDKFSKVMIDAVDTSELNESNGLINTFADNLATDYSPENYEAVENFDVSADAYANRYAAKYIYDKNLNELVVNPNYKEDAP